MGIEFIIGLILSTGSIIWGAAEIKSKLEAKFDARADGIQNTIKDLILKLETTTQKLHYEIESIDTKHSSQIETTNKRISHLHHNVKNTLKDVIETQNQLIAYTTSVLKSGRYDHDFIRRHDTKSDSDSIKFKDDISWSQIDLDDEEDDDD